jgi:hypothetical protein
LPNSVNIFILPFYLFFKQGKCPILKLPNERYYSVPKVSTIFGAFLFHYFMAVLAKYSIATKRLHSF